MKKCINVIFIVLTLVVSSCGGGNGKPDDPSGEPWGWNKGDDEKKDEGPDGETYYPKASGSFRIMSYNIGSFGKYISSVTDNVKMVAAMIKEVGADAVTLNELDSVNTRHNVNEAALLAENLGGWQWHFGRAIEYRNGAYGNGCVVPKDVKVVERYIVALPKDSGAEQRSIAVIETDEYVLGAAHLDHTSSAAQLVQVAAVNTWAQKRYSRSSKPVFFCGDMNATPESETIKTLGETWNMLSSTENTFPSRVSTSCIDYIFHYKNSASVKLVGAHTMTRFHKGDVTMASDHLPIYVDVQF
mgnify:CR=1 FL=1